MDVEGGQLAVRPPQKVRRDGEEAPRLGRGEDDTSVAACFVLCHTCGEVRGSKAGCTFQYQPLPFHRRHITALPPTPPFFDMAAAPNALNPNGARCRRALLCLFLLSFLC